MSLRRGSVALACALTVLLAIAAVASAAAAPATKRPPKKAHAAASKGKATPAPTTTTKAKPAPARFDERFDCAKVTPAAWLTSLMGGFGGALTFKPLASGNHVSDYPLNKGGVGGTSDCNYSQSAGWPDTPTSEGPVEIRIAYGTAALWWYKADHAAALESAVHCKNASQCTPAPLTGLGDQAYIDGNYLAALRGEVFVLVSIFAIPSATTSYTPVPDGLMASVAQAVLARLPAL